MCSNVHLPHTPIHGMPDISDEHKNLDDFHFQDQQNKYLNIGTAMQSANKIANKMRKTISLLGSITL